MQGEYLEIPTSSLRPGAALGFAVYISIAGKHILYIKSSDALEEGKYSKLLQKNIRSMFIKTADKSAYDKFLTSSVEKALKDKTMPMEQRTSIITAVSKGSVEDIFRDPGNKESYLKTEKAAANQVEMLLNNPHALEHLLKVANLDKTVYQHSVNVSTISIGLSAAMGANEQICQVVGVGGLLHDIGRSNDLPLVADKDKLSGDILDKYVQHPRIGANMLLEKKYVSKDVLDIILLHEERLDGKGFPSGLRKIDQIFQVVGLANLYDKMVTFNGKTPKEAYQLIAEMNPPPYDPDMIEGLKEVLEANGLL